MPASTPIFALPYPCQDEVVTANDFLNLANAIDAKLLQVNADMVFALNRPNVDLNTSDTQAIPPGVVTVLTTADSAYTVSTAGVYVVFVEVVSTGAAPATVTYQRAQVRQNAVVRFSFSQDSESNIAMACSPVCVIIAAAGDVITSTFQYTGTGTYTVQTKLSAKLLCRIP
jgi:hypothetical protein